jgi:uncharacterized protein
MSRVLLPALLLLLCSCGDSGSKIEDMNATEVTFPDGSKMLCDTMVRELDVTRGMMFRDSLPEDRGMIFMHAKEQKWQYWMFQVRIPLDIIWMNKDHRIVEISANTPPCTSKNSSECPRYGGAADAIYVLEMNAGGAARRNLKIGDHLAF